MADPFRIRPPLEAEAGATELVVAFDVEAYATPGFSLAGASPGLDLGRDAWPAEETDGSLASLRGAPFQRQRRGLRSGWGKDWTIVVHPGAGHGMFEKSLLRAVVARAAAYGV